MTIANVPKLPDLNDLNACLALMLPLAERTGLDFALLLLEFSVPDQSEPMFQPDLAGQVSGRIRGSIGRGDLFAVLDGSRVAVLAGSGLNFHDISSLALRLRVVMSMPFQSGDSHLRATVNIGIATTRDDLLDSQRMLAHAESALDQAIQSGPIRFFSRRMQDESDACRDVVGGLDRAFDEGHILPWFQPQIDLVSGELTGFEALVRWNHPDKGMLSPASFLSIAEQTGRIERIGEVVLDGALKALQTWEMAGFCIPRVSVNLSPAQLNDPCLADRIRWTMDKLNVDPRRLTVEVLETVLGSADGTIAERNLGCLKDLGVLIDLDDFGTGNASVANIRRFGVHRVKIDRSYITGIDRDPERRAITRALVALADALGVQVVAEGAESAAEWRMLQSMGCRYLQGYALARPMPAEKATEWLRGRDLLQQSA